MQAGRQAGRQAHVGRFKSSIKWEMTRIDSDEILVLMGNETR
jgi:hypothetical protein